MSTPSAFSRRPLTGRPQSMAIDNLDEILTLRSQASETGAGSVGSFDLTRRYRYHQSSEDEKSLPARRPKNKYFHDTASIGRAGSSTSSASLPVNILDGRRPIPAPRMKQVVISVPSIGDHEDHSEQLHPTQSTRSGLFSCLGCFGGGKQGSVSPMQRQTMVAPVFSELPVFEDAGSELIHKLLLQLSELGEIDVNDAIDQRMIFLFFAAVSGDPLLTPDEYHECDEWCDWVLLGYSGSGLENFERDVNRLGSQTLGLMFAVFFAIEYTAAARMCAKIIRNVRFDPPGLFGLFAVNCAKWTRDLLGETLVHKNNSEDFVAKTKKIFPHYPKFLSLLAWWISNGQQGNMDRIEAGFADEESKRASNMYESFVDNDEDGVSPVNIEHRESVTFPPGTESRLTEIDLGQPDQTDLMNRTLIAGGVAYTYVVLSFGKFWLEENLIAADADAAREKLNNAFLEQQFVNKLQLPTNPSQLRKKIKKLSAKINSLWKKSGWATQEPNDSHPLEEDSDDSNQIEIH